MATTEDLTRPRQSPARPAQAGPSSRLEVGLGLVVIAAPLAFVPATFAPFVDPKLVLVAAGALLMWTGLRTRVRFAAPAALWVAALGVATIFGVDRWRSLFGPESSGAGLLLLATSAGLLVAATGVGSDLRSRVPQWLAGTASAMAAISLVYRFAPGLFSGVSEWLPFDGGTLGHPAMLSAFLAAALLATFGMTRIRSVVLVPLLVLLSSALALSTKRVGWVALGVGLLLVVFRSRTPRGRALLIVGVIALTLSSWTVVDSLVVEQAGTVSGGTRFGQIGQNSITARKLAMGVFTQGWTRRPVLGWGPGNTISAYTSTVASDEHLPEEEPYGDAHNLFVEGALTSGMAGLAVLGVLAVIVIRETWRGSSATAWALGGAAALGIYHLLHPLNPALTPLAFLLAGLAGRSPPDDPVQTRDVRARRIVSVLLAGALVLSTASLGAAVLERYGRNYNSNWSLRASLRLAPGRLTAAQSLALNLALDARSGDAEARREAVELARDTVRAHPWDPRVRLTAAGVHMLLNDRAGATTWIEAQRRRFVEYAPQDRPAETHISPLP